MAPIPITLQMLKVLDAFLDDSANDHYGFELSRVTGLKSGTLYPILARLEAAGLLSSGWENLDDSTGRPRRRYYRLTGLGAEAARQELADLRSLRVKPTLPSRHREQKVFGKSR